MFMIKLKSCDGEVFTVEEKVAKVSTTLKTMLEDSVATGKDADEPLFLPKISAFTLKLVLEYSEFHKNDPPPPSWLAELENRDIFHPWDKEFLQKMNPKTLPTLIVAADYLNIQPLLDAASKFVALMVRTLTADEFRTAFGIENDLTPKIEAQIKKSYEWCREKD